MHARREEKKKKLCWGHIGWLRNDRENQRHRLGREEKNKSFGSQGHGQTQTYSEDIATKMSIFIYMNASEFMDSTCCCLPYWKKPSTVLFYSLHRKKIIFSELYFKIKVQKGVSCVITLAATGMDHFSFGCGRWALVPTRAFEIRNSPNSDGSSDAGQPKTWKKPL